MLTAILVGGKVASGITAELGSMKVTEQIDALRTLGVNYIKRLIVPRVLAALLVFPLLTVLADVLGVFGGMVIMFLERGTDMWAYWNTTAYWVVPARLPHRRGQVALLRRHRDPDRLLQRAQHHGGTEGLGRATTATVVHVYDGRDHLGLLPDQAHADAFLVSRLGVREQPRPLTPTETGAVVEAIDLRKRFDGHEVLRGVSFHARQAARRW